jgi:thioredoxin reductase
MPSAVSPAYEASVSAPVSGKPGTDVVDVAIIGAGPYGLSIAAHLRKTKLSYRIFGTPMHSWRTQMPKGMLLKSDGFASTLFDPDSSYTIEHYCAENNLPYEHVGIPVPMDTFIAYGIEFQKRLVPTLEETDITTVHRTPYGFELKTEDGQTARARNVIVAAGISHFGYLPPFLKNLPAGYVTHSSDHHDLSKFRGQRVIVVGAGASAVDVAAILNQDGAKVELVGRREKLAFHVRSDEKKRSWLQRLVNPRSGLGLGWKSRLCTDAPLLFHAMPLKLRVRAVQRHLGPAPGWFVRDKVIGQFPLHMGSKIEGAAVENGQVHLRIIKKDGAKADLVADHVIGATGFRVEMSRLWFLEPALRDQIQAIDESPVLSTTFETTVPGLFMVGVASANSFGPLTRFAYGAGFTSRHLTKYLVGKA